MVQPFSCFCQARVTIFEHENEVTHHAYPLSKQNTCYLFRESLRNSVKILEGVKRNKNCKTLLSRKRVYDVRHTRAFVLEEFLTIFFFGCNCERNTRQKGERQSTYKYHRMNRRWSFVPQHPLQIGGSVYVRFTSCRPDSLTDDADTESLTFMN